MSYRSSCLLIALSLLACESDAPAPEPAAAPAAVSVSVASLYDAEQSLKQWQRLKPAQRSELRASLTAKAKADAAKAKTTAELVPWMTMLRGQLAAPAAVDALKPYEARFDALGDAELAAAKDAEEAGAFGTLLHNAVLMRRASLVGRIGTRLDPLCKLKKRTLDLPKYIARYLCATGKPLLYTAKRGSEPYAADALPLLTKPVRARLGREVKTQQDDARALIRVAVEALSPPVGGSYPCEVTVKAIGDEAITAVYKGKCVSSRPR